MKKLFSVKCPDWAFQVATLLLRLGLGAAMVPHGYQKLQMFNEKKNSFMDPMGIGGPATLALVIFAELICAGLLVLGLFTRLAAIPLIITMAVALFKAHKGEMFGDGEMAALYLFGYVVIALLGPGKISIDGQIK